MKRQEAEQIAFDIAVEIARIVKSECQNNPNCENISPDADAAIDSIERRIVVILST
jgi:hypothetical protein